MKLHIQLEPYNGVKFDYIELEITDPAQIPAVYAGLEAVFKKAPKPTQLVQPTKPVYNNNTGNFPPRKLSEGQRKFAFVLIKQGKLRDDFDMDAPDAYEKFRAAAGDSNDYKANSR